MPSYINGVDTSLIIGLGQIGVTPSPGPTIYPSGGLVVNSNVLRSGSRTNSGYTYGTAPFYNRPYDMASASLGTSTWTKIVGNGVAIYLLSSSGELYSMGSSTSYTSTGQSYKLSKVTTGSSGWTDIAAGSNFALGICDSKLFGIGLNGNGQLGNGTTTAILTNFAVVNSNPWWTRVSCGEEMAMAMSGSGGSGVLFAAGRNFEGRTGQNTSTGNTTTWTRVVNHTSSIFTDFSCGNDFTLAISGGNIFGTGDASAFVFGNNSETDLLTFTLVSGSGIWSRVFAFNAFSKAIDTNTFHYHCGSQTYSRGDGSTANLNTWTRLHTSSAEFSGSWTNFYANNLGSTTYGIIGVNRNRPFYIGQRGTTTDWFPNTTWTDYTTASNEATWKPFVSTSVNVSCSAAGFWGSAFEPTLFIQLTPIS
jgi:hypothetical protein